MQTIGDLFYIQYGQHEINSKEGLGLGNDIIISSQGINYGCYGFFEIEPKYKPPIITVPRTGTIGEAFVQEYKCSVDDNCLVLTPKEKIEIEKLYFIAILIRKEKWRFRYGRQITPSRIGSIKIDFSKTDLQKIRFFRKSVLEKIERFIAKLDVKESDYTREKTTLGHLFDIDYGQGEIHSKEHLESGENLVISSQGGDNGCYGFYDIEPKYKKPVISVPNTGSIGMAFVQEYPCCIDDNCLVLSPKDEVEISIEEMYFIAVLIRLDSWRYRYGRQITDKRLANLEVDFSKFNYAKTKALKDRIESIF